MRLLLDTHALIWFLAGRPELPQRCREAVADEAAEVHVSAAGAWETTTRFRLGKPPPAASLAADFVGDAARNGFLGLPVTVRHGALAGRIRDDRRDPVDRMLIAQALVEDLVLVSNEAVFDRFGVRRLW